MTTNENSDLTAPDLIALRSQPDALKIITERLRVKQMGPADHIRTKHEVKALIEAGGDVKAAAAVIERARARRAVQQAEKATMAQRQGQGMVR